VIEDSPNGVAAARAAGMRVLGFAGVTPAEWLTGADATFEGMSRLPALLDGVSDRSG
jgi:beta-phosphoglucomutase-like phosphatase (HAD superfamily)